MTTIVKKRAGGVCRCFGGAGKRRGFLGVWQQDYTLQSPERWAATVRGMVTA